MLGSTVRMARAVSPASRAYSEAVLWPVCQGPSISLPRHQSLMSYGSWRPWERRRSENLVPEGWLAYSRTSHASCSPRVPRLTAYIVSVPALAAQRENSSRPKALVSTVRQARSMRRGRSETGPTPSSQSYPETKLPPG